MVASYATLRGSASLGIECLHELLSSIIGHMDANSEVFSELARRKLHESPSILRISKWCAGPELVVWQVEHLATPTLSGHHEVMV